MRKLALVVPSLSKGGGVPSVARFVKDAALRSGRYEVHLVSLCMASNESSSRLLLRPTTWLRGPTVLGGEWEGLPFVHVGANWAEFEFQRYKPRKVLANLLSDCDVIQVVCGSPAWANAVTGMNKPIALQVATRVKVERRQRDISSKGLRGIWGRIMTTVTNRIDDRGLQSVEAIQVENLWMLEYAKKLNSSRKVDLRYAPPGIDAQLFRPLSDRKLLVNPYILCVGRMSDVRKNIGLLLKAYAELKTALGETVPLVLAGASSPSDAFWNHAKQLGVSDNISFIKNPSRDELVSLYQNATVFALPSDEEGLGVVVLEAMACGVPVVSTRSGGPDGIISDSVNGYLVPLNDSVAMADRIKSLLLEPAINAKMGIQARKAIEERFEEVAAGEVFVDMWDRLLSSDA